MRQAPAFPFAAWEYGVGDKTNKVYKARKVMSEHVRAEKQMACLQRGLIPNDTKNGRVLCVKPGPRIRKRPSGPRIKVKGMSPDTRRAECMMRPGRLINIAGGRQRCIKIKQPMMAYTMPEQPIMAYTQNTPEQPMMAYPQYTNNQMNAMWREYKNQERL